ncbi:kinase-like domain-containing protein [Haematococcus lacustris]
MPARLPGFQWPGSKLSSMSLRVAVKRLQFSSLVGQEQASVQRRQVLLEAELNAGLSHRNLMATYAYHVRAVGDSSSDQGVRDWVLQLVCELCSGGSLYDAMAKGRLWDTESSLPVLGLVLAIMGDVADAMAYVHSRNILHMDLKPENVLLKPEGSGLVAKVADLGLSAVMGPNRTHLSQAWAGTPLYRAPEVALHGRASPAADVYSFGVMAWELLHGCFAAQRLQQLTQEPRHLLFLEPHPELFASHCPPHPPRPTATQAQPVLQGLQDLVHNCLQHQPQARPTFPDLVQRLNVLAERQLKAQAVG